MAVSSGKWDRVQMGILGVLSRDFSGSDTLLLCRRDSFCEAELFGENDTMPSSTNWKLIIITKSQSRPHSLAHSVTSGITQTRFCKCENFSFSSFPSVKPERNIIPVTTWRIWSLPIWAIWSITCLAQIPSVMWKGKSHLQTHRK